MGKLFRKNPIQKIEKTLKIRVKLPLVNKKPLPRNRIFVQAPFSHSTLKLERKKMPAAKRLAFSLHFLFRRDQNHHSNLTWKIMKMCEQILKHSRTSADVQFKEFSLTKQKTRPRTDYESIGKTIYKKIRSKNIEKTVKIREKLPHVNKKPLPRNRIFVQTPFSHSTLKLEQKKFTPQNHLLFRSISCFGVTKITTPIWLQKSWKCVNRS